MPAYLRPFAAFYFFYFAYVGMMSPYWGPYLSHLGLSPWQMGILMMLYPLSRLGPPYFWGWLADRYGYRRRLMIVGAVAAWLAFSLLLWRQDFVMLWIALALAQFFWAAVLPLAEATTLRYTARLSGGYPRVRAWGSYGFMGVTFASGFVIERLGVEVTPWLIWGGLLALSVAACFVPDAQRRRASSRVSGRQPVSAMWLVLRQPVVLALFICLFLMGFSHGPYYSFYSVGLSERGYSSGQIGMLWALGVLAEIVMFRVMVKMSQTAVRLMVWSLWAAVIRFSLMALGADWGAVMIVAQILHAWTFAVHHVASQRLLHELFPADLQGRAQGLYSMVAFGMGGSLGGVLAGAVWPLGNMLAAFVPSVVAAGVAAGIAWWYLPESALRRELERKAASVS